MPVSQRDKHKDKKDKEKKAFPPKLAINTAVLTPNLRHGLGPAKSELGQCHAPSSALCQIFANVLSFKGDCCPRRANSALAA